MTSTKSAVVTLPSDTQILIRREFDAPRHLVYTAYTTPELVRRWWSGHRGTVTSVDIDLRIGGSWRYVMTANAGFEVGFHGTYSDIVTNERLVSTEVFEGVPDAEAVSTARFIESDDRTVLELLVEHTSAEHRNMHLESGMEGGMQEAMDRLSEAADTLR
jgi:uncharacterized protein YndB with AHSA1/START domain